MNLPVPLYIVLFLHQTATARGVYEFFFVLYIVLFLHQTATLGVRIRTTHCCISFYSYIKPQPILKVNLILLGCISFYSYIKPQQQIDYNTFSFSCISFYSYIKPQPVIENGVINRVVYRSIPTSNRNSAPHPVIRYRVVYRSIPTSNRNDLIANTPNLLVVYRSIPTSNRNIRAAFALDKLLYIVLFLHQTATIGLSVYISTRCISFYSYIKPQHWVCTNADPLSCISFYSYIKPQPRCASWYCCRVVYRSIPTSNRNLLTWLSSPWLVVYRSIPTSNRNSRNTIPPLLQLYIVLFLHQTATSPACVHLDGGCISFYSYIKPQHRLPQGTLASRCISFYSYIKPQLVYGNKLEFQRCISFYSYIKPQLHDKTDYVDFVVYRSIPTSNRNGTLFAIIIQYVVYRSIPTSNRNLIL